MTKINKMIMNGFKSFGRKTEFLFGDDYNCVIGPNGSGKSNVLDSLCFVLGKSGAKGMRAEKSANLIYNGGKSKKPAPFGEVSIFFDNSKKTFPTEDKEVKVTRVIKPSGQGVYKINDKAVTRQQILDLLGIANINPDGYNIILQGDVIKLIDASPNDKRTMLDEISGISVYEEKKNKALRELEKVDQRLGESEIILKERETHLKELKKDRDHAQKYKDLNDKLIQNKATYCNMQMERKQSKEAELSAQIEKHKAQVDKHNKCIEELRDQIKEWKDGIKSISSEIEQKGEKEQVKLNKEVEKLRVDTNTNNARIGSIQQELQRINQRKDQLQKNLLDLGENIDGYSKKMQDLENSRLDTLKMKESVEEKIAAFKKKHKMEDTEEIDKEMESIDKEAEEKEKEIQKLREEQQELLRQKDRLEFQIQGLDQKLAKVKEVEKEHKTEMQNLKSRKAQLGKLGKELDGLIDDNTQISSKIGTTRTNLFRTEEELAKLRVEEVNVKERMFSNMAVKKIIENKSRLGGVYGTIADLGKVNSRYSQALEVAAGQKINSIVVEDDATAAKCIKYLKTNKFGTATFLPLNKIKEFPKDADAERLRKSKGVQGYAIDLIDFDTKFKKAFSFVFGNTLIVDDIDTARSIGIGKARMATLTGDLTEHSGAMHGGYKQKAKAASFRNADNTKSIDKLENEIGSLRSALNLYENQKEQNEDGIQKLRNEKANLEGDIIMMEKKLHLSSDDTEATMQTKEGLGKELAQVDTRLDKAIESISEINREFAKLKIRKQQLRERITQLRNPRLLAELNAFEQKRQELTEKAMEMQTKITGFESQIKNIFSRDKDNTSKILNDIAKEEEAFKQEITDLKEKIKTQSLDLKEKEEVQKAFSAQFRGLFEKRSKLNEDMIKAEGTISNMQERNRSEEYKLNTFNLETAKIRAELSGLQEEMSRYEGVQLFKSKTEQQLRYEISQCEKMKDDMGNVNMRALEIYDQVQREYESLLEKKTKLVSEKEDVLMLMNEIEGKKKDLFMKTFDAINQNFQKIFLNLSTKGSAFLELENPENPFEGGLLMKVRLRGNKFMDIRSLSGGEKTMTALAFLFSVQEHQPASFYILDEVDAALDKHNSEKLAKLVKSYCDRAQYIVISHNDAVISEASRIYGVSMDEHGISNVTSLQV